MSIKQELHEMIEQLSAEEAEEAADYIRWLLLDEDEITDEEYAGVLQGQEEIRRGDFVTLDELRRSIPE